MMATDNVPPYGPRRLKWSLRFTLRTFLLVTFVVAALLAYLLRPGHLTTGRVRVDFHVEGFEYQDFIEDTGSGEVESRSLMAIIRATNLSGNTLWYRGGYRECPDLIVGALKDNEWQWVTTGFVPSHTHALHDGETIRFGVSIDQSPMKVGVAFASKWFGEFEEFAMTDELDVDTIIKDMKTREEATANH